MQITRGIAISGVSYNPEHSHIIAVKAFLVADKKLLDEHSLAREDIVAFIKKGGDVITVTKDAGKAWVHGEEVAVFPVNGTDYIKTVANETEADNLGDLPEF